MHNQTFAFESDFVASLRCIPMAVRLKLDMCAVKLTLRQWSHLDGKMRRQLLDMPCETPAEAQAYRAVLLAHAAHGDPARLKRLDGETGPIVPSPDCLPQQVCAFALSQGLPAISIEGWARLTGLQRFALVKLSRDNHDNVNFVPALREFGLAV